MKDRIITGLTMNPRTITEMKVAFFTHCRSKSGGVNVSLAEIIEGTREGKWAYQVNALRRLPYKSDAYSAAKEHLPCFMISATTATGGHKAADIARHSGLLQIDVDDVGESEAVSIRNRIGADPHILAAWLSPGAVGVKGAIRIPADVATHRQAFEKARDYLAENYGVTIDKRCSDPCRLCFMSYDPDLRFNPDAVPILVNPASPPQARLLDAGHTPSKNSSPLLSSESTSPSCILHNTCELFQDFPALLPFYDQQVRRKLGTPSRGLRNAALVELVASTFCVVHPRFVIDFADHFHRERHDIFAGYPHEKWMREAHSALAGCLSDYEKKNLGPKEAAIYHTLPDDEHAATFRICRSLAACESDPMTPPPEFFLSSVQLGSRLGVLDMQAWRIMRRLEKKGAITEIKKGTRRRAGEKATATRFRWTSALNAILP